MSNDGSATRLGANDKNENENKSDQSLGDIRVSTHEKLVKLRKSFTLLSSTTTNSSPFAKKELLRDSGDEMSRCWTTSDLTSAGAGAGMLHRSFLESNKEHQSSISHQGSSLACQTTPSVQAGIERDSSALDSYSRLFIDSSMMDEAWIAKFRDAGTIKTHDARTAKTPNLPCSIQSFGYELSPQALADANRLEKWALSQRREKCKLRKRKSEEAGIIEEGNVSRSTAMD